MHKGTDVMIDGLFERSNSIARRVKVLPVLKHPFCSVFYEVFPWVCYLKFGLAFFPSESSLSSSFGQAFGYRRGK